MAPVSPVPPDRLGASGLCQRLWPLQTPIYMTGERRVDWIRERGKYEPDSSVCVLAVSIISVFVRRLRARMPVVVRNIKRLR